jgi:hypothetical protein
MTTYERVRRLVGPVRVEIEMQLAGTLVGEWLYCGQSASFEDTEIFTEPKFKAIAVACQAPAPEPARKIEDLGCNTVTAADALTYAYPNLPDSPWGYQRAVEKLKEIRVALEKARLLDENEEFLVEQCLKKY